MNVTGKLCQLRPVLQSCRNLHITYLARNASAYEGPGKTTVSFLTKEIGPRLLVTHCDENGFTLNTGTKVIGPMVLFPRNVICWNITSGEHINDATLSLFTVLEPKPDLLIIGLDDKYNFPYIRSIQDLVRKHDIKAEITSVYNACTVFNFVNEEGRYVVATLIPQKLPKSRLILPNNKHKKQITDSKGTVNDKTTTTNVK